MLKAFGEAMDDTDDFIASRHRERAAWTEIILHVDNKQHIRIENLH